MEKSIGFAPYVPKFLEIVLNTEKDMKRKENTSFLGVLYYCIQCPPFDYALLLTLEQAFVSS